MRNAGAPVSSPNSLNVSPSRGLMIKTETYAFGMRSSVMGISNDCAFDVTSTTDLVMTFSRSTVMSARTPLPWNGDFTRSFAVSPTWYSGLSAITSMRLLFECGQLKYVEDHAYTDVPAFASRP